MNFVRTLVVISAALAVSSVLAAPAPPVIGGLESQTRISPKLAGTILIGELGCTACHASGDPSLAPKGGPDLSDAGSRMRPGHLEQFLTSPSATKPGTTMPDVLDHLPDAERHATALALAHYLASLGTTALKFDPPAADAITRGKTLYQSVGCVACHSPEQLVEGSVPLGPLEEKYSVASLAAFLENPLEVRPSGRMPDSRLGHFEAVDIASYLLRQQPAAMPPFQPDAKLAERGKALFAEHRCQACHEVAGPRVPPPLIALHKVRPDRGCLSGKPGPWPHYPLSAPQRSAIRAALSALPEPLTTAANVELTLVRLNCLACHPRGDLGGVPANRDAFFTGVDENLGDQGRLPPSLTGVGAKLKRDWLRDVVVNGASVRPYLHTRMPKFGEANAGALVDQFKQIDHLPPAVFTRGLEAEKPDQVGRELAGSTGFNCVACHTFREQSAAPIRALDLMTMIGRLEENWFHLYLAAPQRFSPLTIMPGFWPDGKSPLPKVLGGDPGKQRDALWQYLEGGPDAGEPRGLVLEPLVLTVRDEAVMLRRAYPGIGKRGIGVGYPAGINLSFDAGQMRLGSIWTGGFIEASGFWRGQGAGNANILGKDTVNFPAGPAFAVLASATGAWPTNLASQAVGLEFKGYWLDAKQRPTFRYQFHQLVVEDRFLDVKDASSKPHFERILTFSKGAVPAGLYLRLADDRQIEPLGARDYAVGKTLRLRLPAAGIVRDTATGRELLLPLAGSAPITIEYHLAGQP
jgi:mono/diheme cytochrome c family protein